MFPVPVFREHEINPAHINLRLNLDLEKGFDLLLLILFDNHIGNNIVIYKDRNILCGKAFIHLDLQSVFALRK